MGAVLRRLLDIPAPRRTRPSKRPDPPATNDGPGLAHQHRCAAPIAGAPGRRQRTPFVADGPPVHRSSKSTSASGTSAYKHGIIVLAGVLPSRRLIEYNWV